MKLHADKPDQLSVTAHGKGWVAVNGERYSTSVVLLASGTVRPWGVERLEELTSVHFSDLIGDDGPPPELVLLGSGNKLRFVAPALLRPLIERRIGVETMDTPAACRTFNILAGEGRRVVAALLIEADA
ncbi:Mth938-like domain-containing protein [Hydrogenophaga pseudoflava]|uniref:Mth938-like domain-containing protein n=1 Tax=Hydrogenophaga pseudoflava TaxID=47421 RepID=UPI0027E55F6F|nr:Mth938-like domain-containing protein [Hydrogenophaga pseudoflava]MDQ7744083.1 Mth938-like domain-containing protein [Hydrogenophaga pseudoflava]